MQKFEERECVVIENEGQKIFGVLHRPLVKHKVPVVITCHGFAGTKIGKYRIYLSIAERLAKAGIATLRIDFRGSGESEGSFSDMTIESEVSDVLKAIAFLRADSLIDAGKIGLLGNSFGGLVSVLAASKDLNIQSLVLLAALFDNKQWIKHWDALGKDSSNTNAKKELNRMLDGNVPGNAFFKSFFQLHLDPHFKTLNDIPLLHIHSENDDRVGIGQAEHYKRCRQDAKAATKWVRLQKSDHDFSDTNERAMLIEEAAQWFCETLK